jgi:Uma2 family endonuclease
MRYSVPMDAVNATDTLSRYQVPRHRLTVHDYHRLGTAGILRRDDRVELLEGQLVDMSPIGPRHALAVDALTELLVVAAAGHATVRVQGPIVLDDISEPQPDFALLRRPWDGYPHAHPRPPDVHLLIEVSDSSLEFDLGPKLELCARAGIGEFWVVDVTASRVLVHRRPKDGRYGSVTIAGLSDTLEVEALPGVTISVASIFV